MKNIENINDVTRFCPDEKSGLTSTQVNQRISEKLTNKTSKQYSKSYLNIFVGNVCTYFNLLGIIVFFAMLSIGNHAKLSDYFFVIFYIANISIGIFQEIRAKRCIDKLSLISSKATKVIRDGEIKEICSDEIVLDDVIILGIGAQIPTDCKVLSGNIEVNESNATFGGTPDEIF